jgi:hypothetical protein
MRLARHLAVACAALLTACSTMPQRQDTPHVLVLGRISNQHYEHVDIDGDVLGHGWITANLKVQRVLDGSLSKRVLTIRYFAHTYYREDISMRFKLKKAPDGTYQICVPKGKTGVRCDL